MIKVVFDGNPSDGYSIHARVPCLKTSPHELETNLIVTDAEKLVDCLPQLRAVILDVEGYDLFEQEFVIVHEDSSFEPGPHESEHQALMEAEREDHTLTNTSSYLQDQVASSSEQMLEAIAQGKIDISTLPKSFPDEQ